MNYSHFVGIDVSKLTFDASILDSEENELAHRKFKNSSSGVQEMLDWATAFQADISSTLFCAENMGCYVYQLSVASVDKKFNLALACPLSIKKSLGLQRGKNDRIDARRIAEYAYVHQRQLKMFRLPDDDLVKVRDMLNLRGVFVKYKVSITKLVETAEYHYTKGESPCLSKLKAELEEVTTKIKDIEKEISEIMSANVSVSANYSLIQSIVGIGQINAATIIVMTENFTKFDNPRKFACYCGVAPFEHTSGTSIRGKTRTSKLAAKDLKVLLTRAAITAMVHDPQIKAYYARKVAEGKHKASVINAIRAKIIYRCFAVVRRHTPFVKLMA